MAAGVDEGVHCECGGKLKPLGEDVTEELDYMPGRFVVNRIVRPRLACTCCEAIRQAPLPSRPTERGRPVPGGLARVLVAGSTAIILLYRQSHIFEREGIELDSSTLADWVGRRRRCSGASGRRDGTAASWAAPPESR